MNIYIAFPLTAEEKELINTIKIQGETWIWSQDMSVDLQLAAFKTAEIVFGNVPAKWITDAGSLNLKWIQLYSAGFDDYLKLDWANTLKDICVTNLRGFFGQPVAETAVAGVLSLYRKLNELAVLQERGQWKGATLRPSMQMLYQKQVLILGAGAIGQTAKQLFEGFSCQVTVISRSQPPTLEDLDQLLIHADIVVNALPDTDETKHLFNERRLNIMKPSAIFVNVGRGTVVDEGALIRALKDKKLGGAILDVTSVEPLPGDSLLWDCPDLLLTQHTGGGYKEENLDKVRFFIQNLQCYRSGKSLYNVISFSKGY